MDFESIIYNILNEDSDRLRSLRLAAAANDPQRTRDTYPGTKSSFEEGSVHMIPFKNIVDGQKRVYREIYRKISKAEYDSLKRSYKIVAAVVPSKEEEHFKDVYYTAVKQYTKGDKSKKNSEDDYNPPKEYKSKQFIYLSKKEVDQYNRELPDEYKLELVPLKDIYEKGIGVRSTSIKDYIEYVEKLEKSKEFKKQSLQKPKSDVEQETKDFLINNSSTLDKIESLYDQYKKPGQKADAVEEYKSLLVRFIKRYTDSLKDEKNDTVIAKVWSTLKEKFSGKMALYNMLVSEYTNTDTKTKPAPDTSPEPKFEPKKQKIDKPKPSTNAKVDKDDAKSKGQEFMLDNNNIYLLNNMIKAFSEFEDRKNSREEREYQRGKVLEYIGKLLNNVYKTSKKVEVTDYIVNEMIRNRIAALAGQDDTELYSMLSRAYEYQKKQKMANSKKENSLLEMEGALPDDMSFDVIIKYSSDSVKPGYEKTQEAKMKGKSIKALVKKDSIEFKKEYDFQKVVEVPVKKGSTTYERETVSGKITVLKPSGGLVPDRNLMLKGKRDSTGKSINTNTAEKEKDKNFRTSIAGQPAGFYKAPDNRGVARVNVTPNQLRRAFYVVDTENKKYVPGGFDNWGDAKLAAANLNSKENVSYYKAVPKIAVSKYTGDIYEEFTDKEKNEVKSKKISFKVRSSDPKKPDAEEQVDGTIKTATFNKKDGLVIIMDDNSEVVFSNEDTGKYYKNPQDKQNFNVVNFVPNSLKGVLKKAFAAPKTETKLESYIRKRIQRALQETELSQYMGAQGPEVKKKRLEEYMKKYEWGFQESEDPYVRSNGTEKHSIVSKLVHELGDEGVSIFNSYAPKGYEIARPDDLNDMADSPLGSQMARPFEPNTLTMRGGRVAESEEAKYDTLYKQAKAEVEKNYKTIEDLAIGYNNNDRAILRSSTVKKAIESLISQEYGKDASKASPQLRKAFMRISDEDLKKSR
jgi:hypothetical protein